MSQQQGLIHFIQQARQHGIRITPQEKPITIPIYSFINQLVSSIKKFIQKPEYHLWAQYLLDNSERSLPSIISTFRFNMKESWLKLKQTSLQCNLLQSLLYMRSKNKIRMYLKARKLILATSAENQMMDEILMDLQNCIAVIHKLFMNEHVRKVIIQGIKNIFMAFRITEAKIYSSVFIEYLMATFQSVFKLQIQQATISQQFTQFYSKSSNSNYVELFSSISNFQSGIHNQNGLYMKKQFSHGSHKKYQIIDRKFLPMHQTSKFVQFQEINESTLERQKKSTSMEKSSFYDFVSQRPSKERMTELETNDIMFRNSFDRPVQCRHSNYMSKSSQKQQPVRLSKQKFKMPLRSIQKQRPTNDHFRQFADKVHNESHNKSYSQSQVKKYHNESQQSHTHKKKPQSKFSVNLPHNISSESQSKNFSLSWLSKKMFQTSGQQDTENLGFLQQSKMKMKKESSDKKKLQVSLNSAERFEIQNQVMNIDSIRRSDAKPFEEDSQAESIKKEQFEKMISKNQEFKEKMLRKNSPSGQLSENQSRLSFQKPSFQRKILQQHHVNHKVTISDPNSRVQVNSRVKSYQYPTIQSQDQSRLKQIPPQQIKMTKKSNNKVLESYPNTYNDRNSYYESNQGLEEMASNQIYNYIYEQSPQPLFAIHEKQKPQILHKSINKKTNPFLNSSQQSQYQYASGFDTQQRQEQSKSFNMSKMKNIINIIDDYKKNATENEEQSQFQISESFCKKSRLHINERSESYPYESSRYHHDYSFEQA